MDVKDRRHSGLTIGSVLVSGVRAAGGNEIITNGGLRLSYVQLRQRIHRLGAVLQALGVGDGTRVAWADRDTHRYLEAYFAVPMLGATLVTANIRLSATQLRYTLEHSKASVVVTAAEFLPLMEQALVGAVTPPRIVVIDHDGATSLASSLEIAGGYETFLERSPTHFVFPDVAEDAIATLFYTTGTTGLPKAVSYTHRQLVEHTLAVGLALASADDYQSLRVGDVYMPLTPMFHVHAWGVPYIATLLGLKQVYPGRYDATTLPALVQAENVSFSHCVPTVLQMVLDEAKRQERHLHGWKVMVGGSAMSPALASQAVERGIHVFAGYGMSETCPVVCFARADSTQAHGRLSDLCRAGHPVPLVETKLLDCGEGPEGGQGELALRAPWLTRGYVDDQEGTRQLWEGGYLHTGDVASVDVDGAIRIVDRLKDIIKSGGEWVSSLDLEAMLRTHPAVADAAVIGVADQKWGERPRAFVKLHACEVAVQERVELELRQLFAAQVRAGEIPRLAIPDQFRFVAEIPKTSVGKINKKILRTLDAG